MSGRAELPPQRFRYWQGQMLRAADFRAQVAAAQNLAAWHTRAIHSMFGVRFGFEVTMSGASPPVVAISCGIAFDCSGSMLILQRTREMVMPELQSGEHLLLLVRERQSDCSCGPRKLALPDPCDEGELWERNLEFCWRPRRPGVPDGVPLAALSVDENGEIILDASVRIHARPMARPHIGSGSTVAGLTPWEPWEHGVQTHVDTSAAGFTQIPCYAAKLVATAPGETLGHRSFFTHISSSEINEFTFRVLGPSLVGIQATAAGDSIVISDVSGARAAGVVATSEGGAAPFQPGDRVVAVSAADSSSVSEPIHVLGIDRGQLQLSHRVDQLGPQARLVLAPLSRVQNRLRLTDVTGLSAGDQVRVFPSGSDDNAILGAELATIERIEPETRSVFLRFSPSFEGSFAVENLQLARLDSDGFSVAFIQMAKRTGLAVCWIGCQGPEFKPPACPGQLPAPPACEDTDEMQANQREEIRCR